MIGKVEMAATFFGIGQRRVTVICRDGSDRPSAARAGARSRDSAPPSGQANDGRGRQPRGDRLGFDIDNLDAR
jgi:hypothetical protein